ncbi:MAG: hypothetical protein Q8O30_06390 [Candidatus Omnitrophota bacterium]|nr:hypothetical protein [Candidatus Omnitrophota bacterium]
MKSFLVRLSGIYTTAVGVVVIVVSVWKIISSDKLSYKLSHDSLFLAAAIIYIVLLGFWPILTGTGIMLRRNWARYSLFVMSVFALCVGLSSLLPLIFVPSSVINPQAASTRTVFEAFISVVNFIFFIGLPTVFLILFNRKAVRQLFKIKAAEPKKSARPLGITLIAIFTFFTGVSFAIFLFAPTYAKFPFTFIGTLLLTGKLERIYFLAVALLSFYISLGFLRMKKNALLAFIIFIVSSITIGVINTLVVPKVTIFVRLPSINSAYKEMPEVLYKLSSMIVILIPISLLFYVLSKKQLFLKSGGKGGFNR